MRAIPSDDEVRERLKGIARYNDYFTRELDKDGQPLTQHIVSNRQLWNIMTREWGVDPRKFGIAEPPAAKWKQAQAEPAATTENLADDL